MKKSQKFCKIPDAQDAQEDESDRFVVLKKNSFELNKKSKEKINKRKKKSL